MRKNKNIDYFTSFRNDYVIFVDNLVKHVERARHRCGRICAFFDYAFATNLNCNFILATNPHDCRQKSRNRGNTLYVRPKTVSA